MRGEGAAHAAQEFGAEGGVGAGGLFFAEEQLEARRLAMRAAKAKSRAE